MTSSTRNNPIGMSQVHGSSAVQELKTAWFNLTEENRRRIVRAIAKARPEWFKGWRAEAVPLGGFKDNTVIQRKAGTGAMLDKVFFSRHGGAFAIDCIKLYFSNCDTSINSVFLDLSPDSSKGRNPTIAEQAVQRLYSRFPKCPDMVCLYEVALRIIEPDWFRITQHSNNHLAPPEHNITPQNASTQPSVPTAPYDIHLPSPPVITRQNSTVSTTFRPDMTDQDHSTSLTNQTDSIATIPPDSVQNDAHELLSEATDKDNTPSEGFPCSSETPAQLKDLLHVVKQSLTTLEHAARDIVTRTNTLPISDVRASDAVIAEFQGHIGTVFTNAQQLCRYIISLPDDAVCHDCSESPRCNSNIRAVSREIHDLRTAPSTLSNTVISAGRVLSHLTSINEHLAQIIIESQRLERETRILCRQLQIDQPASSIVNPFSSCKTAIDYRNDLQTTHSRLSTELTQHIGRSKEDIRSQMSELLSRYDLTSGDTTLRDRKNTIERKVEEAKTIADIETAQHAWVSFAEEVKRNPMLINVAEVANKALHYKCSTESVLQLIRALAAKSMHETALSILSILQNTRSFEESQIECFDDICEICLLTLTALSQRRQFLFDWTTVIRHNPWIAAIHNNDVRSDHTRLRLAGVIALCVNSERASSLAEFCLRTKLHEAVVSVKCSTLARVIERLIRNQTVSFSYESQDTVSDTIARDINEWLRMSNGKYVHLQSKGTPPFATMEAKWIFPTLAKIWSQIREFADAAHFSKAHTMLSTLSANAIYHDSVVALKLKNADHGYFTPKITSFLDKVLSSCEHYVASREAKAQVHTTAISLADVMNDIDKLSIGDPGMKPFWTAVKSVFSAPRVTDMSGDALLPYIFNTFGSVVPHLHQMIVRYCDSPHFSCDKVDLDTVVGNIASAIPLDTIADALKANRCWKHLHLWLCDLPDQKHLAEDIERAQVHEIAQLEGRLRLLLTHNNTSVDAPLVQRMISTGKYLCADSMISAAERQLQTEEEKEQYELKAWCDMHLAKLPGLKHRAYDIWARDKIYDNLAQRIQSIETLFMGIKHGHLQDVESEKNKLTKAMSILAFYIEQRHIAFEELDTLLCPSAESLTSQEERIPDEYSHLIDTWRSFASMNSEPVRESHVQWYEFIKEFAKACGLKHELGETLIGEDILAGHLRRYRNSFKQPRCRALSHELHFYLLLGPKPRTDDVRLLYEHARDDDQFTYSHIIFVPGDVERTKAFLDKQQRLPHLLVIDTPVLNTILSYPDPLTRLPLPGFAWD